MQAAVTTDEASRLYEPQVKEWVEALTKLGLPGGTFAITSIGMPGSVQVAVDVGIFWQLFERHGCEIVSHSAQVVKIPKMVSGSAQAEDRTITSLLVRLPKQKN